MKDKIIPLKCPTCGANIPRGTLICEYCGTSIILPEYAEERLKLERETDQLQKMKIEELIGSRFYIAEIHDAMEDRTRLLESARKLPNVVSVEFIAPYDTLRDVTVEGQIIELGERQELSHGWSQLSKLRDDTGDIMLHLYEGMFNGDDAYKGDTVRVEHGDVYTWWLARGQVVLSPTTFGGSGDWQIILNPKVSIPHPSSEWVELRLKEIREERRYGQDALKVLKLLIESEQPIKYGCYYEDLVFKSVNAGIDRHKVEKIINLLHVGDINGLDYYNQYYLVDKYTLSIHRKDKPWRGSTIQYETVYSIRRNLRPYLQELLMKYV